MEMHKRGRRPQEIFQIIRNFFFYLLRIRPKKLGSFLALTHVFAGDIDFEDEKFSCGWH
jgi:hypothetical protein